MVKPVPRVHKAKARARLSKGSVYPGNTSANANAEELVPESKSDREARRVALRNDIHAQQPLSKLSRQKKKRLDKYIDTKLKKEENLDIIKKLSKQDAVDTSLFKSSKKLGRTSETRKEELAHAIRTKRAGVAQDDADGILFEPPAGSNDEDDEVEAPFTSKPSVPVSEAPTVQNVVSGKPISAKPPINGFGSALKRPLDIGEDGAPIIPSRKRTKSTAPVMKSAYPIINLDDDWEGFSSEGSTSDLETGAGVTGSDEAEDIDSDDELRGSSDGTELSEDLSEDGGSSSSEGIDSDVEEDEDDDDDGETSPNGQDRMSNFKAWAMSQRNEATGYQPASAPDLMSIKPTAKSHANSKPIQPVQPTLGLPKSERPGRHAYHVPVQRSDEVESVRSALPVVGKEQEIMETIFSNDCTIVTGATGSGKTTQVPQFLFEAGYGSTDSPTSGMIGVTQPRRVAALSMAKRVAYELGTHGDRVSHQIRFDSTVGPKTAIKFMTDGVLLREVAQDFVLSKYSAIVVDEAHERSVNTDILIGMLSRIVETRAKLSKTNDSFKPLKLIIMSATLRVTDFANNATLFRTGSPPIVEAEGKAHPVVTHFARKTHREYVDDAIRKVGKGHRKLPPGAMLVFLTGQNEIVHMEQKLKEMFQPTEETSENRPKMRVSAAETSIENEDMDFGTGDIHDKDDFDDGEGTSFEEPDDLDFDIEPEEARVLQRVHVLPLYSQLPSDLQMRVFEPPPESSRLIVLATNVAETSLTIPGVRYVFDCGRAKEKSYEPVTGVQSFEVDWISKASADQRRGRAGRTGPGHCYRLYSSAVYENHFAQHTTPEIMRVPIEGVVLQLKGMGIPNVTQFPFPTPPDRTALSKAQRLLESLGAVRDDTVTEVGKQIAYYPVSPRLARILVSAIATGVLEHAIALVAILSADEILIPDTQLNIRPDDADVETDAQETTRREQRRHAYNAFHAHAARLDRHSDALKLLTLFCDYTADPTSAALATHAHVKRLHEAAQLRSQLARLVATHTRARTLQRTPLPSPTPAQAATLRALLAAGFVDLVAQRADASPTPPTSSRRPASAAHVPYLPLTPLGAPTPAPQTEEEAQRAQQLHIHASSTLAHARADRAPRFVLYTHLSRAGASTVGGAGVARTRLHALAPVSVEALLGAARGTPLLGEGKPVGNIETLERSAQGEERRRVWSVPFLKSLEGRREWPLPPARRVVQRRVRGKGWVEEEEEGREQG